MKKLFAAPLSLALLISACSLSDDDGEPTNPDTNAPPTVTLVASPTSGPAPLNVTLTATASDLDGDDLSYRWSLAGLPDAASVTTELTEAGAYPISVVVSDGEAEASATTTVTVTEEGTDPTDPTDPGEPTDPTEPQITVNSSPGGPAPWMVRYDYSATGIPEGASVNIYCTNDIGSDRIISNGLGPNIAACLHVGDNETVKVEVRAGEADNFEVLASETFRPAVEPASEVPFAGTWRFTSVSKPPFTFDITQSLDSGIGGSDSTGTNYISYGVDDAVGELIIKVGEVSASALSSDLDLEPLEDGTQRIVSADEWPNEPFVLEKID